MIHNSLKDDGMTSLMVGLILRTVSFGRTNFSIAQQTSHTHMDTVDLPMPNNSESVLKSVPDVRYYNATPILFSSGMAMRISVFCR